MTLLTVRCSEVLDAIDMILGEASRRNDLVPIAARSRARLNPISYARRKVKLIDLTFIVHAQCAGITSMSATKVPAAAQADQSSRTASEESLLLRMLIVYGNALGFAV